MVWDFQWAAASALSRASPYIAPVPHPRLRCLLQGLYRTCTSQNRRLADFLSRDFSQPANRQAASKNAFVLLGQHRYSLAAAFFILGGCLTVHASRVAAWCAESLGAASISELCC